MIRCRTLNKTGKCVFNVGVTKTGTLRHFPVLVFLPLDTFVSRNSRIAYQQVLFFERNKRKKQEKRRWFHLKAKRFFLTSPPNTLSKRNQEEELRVGRRKHNPNRGGQDSCFPPLRRQQEFQLLGCVMPYELDSQGVTIS